MAGSTSKKRKRDAADGNRGRNGVNTAKPSAVFSPTGLPRKHTLSVALPGSFLNNAHSLELKTLLAGQIARALAVFCVDEVVIFDDGVRDDSSTHNDYRSNRSDSRTTSDDLLALLLSYLETPPHMRKRLFPMNSDLKKAGLLPSLDLPHHLRHDEWCRYREGVTIERSDVDANRQVSPGFTSVDVGFPDMLLEVNAEIPGNTRITIKFPNNTSAIADPLVDAVAPSTPREEAGWYWGYEVRQVSSISRVLTECPWKEGYDMSIGTSERGRPVQEILELHSQAITDVMSSSEDIESSAAGELAKALALSKYSHLLLVFGGHQGLEVAAHNDPELKSMRVEQPEELFDWWVNLCPGQGSRTIRTEEAVWLGLNTFHNIVQKRNES